jgi:hypothetical protein
VDGDRQHHADDGEQGKALQQVHVYYSAFGKTNATR